MTLKLEYGKFYVQRDGEVVGPLVRPICPPSPSFRFEDVDTGCTWRVSGRYWGDFDDDPRDLVAEYKPEAEPEIIIGGHTYVLKSPVIETVVYEGYYQRSEQEFYAGEPRGPDEIPVKITFDTIDGKPDWNTARVTDS